MYDKLMEQTQSAVKPFGELMALNVKAMEQVVEKQSALFTGVLKDGVTYAQDLSAQRDITGVYQAQKTYFEGVQEKMVNVAKDIYSVIADAQEKVGAVIKSASSDFKPATVKAGK